MKELTNDQMHRIAPSIFADQPFHEVSDRYRFIPTIDVVEALRQQGWFPASVQESVARLEQKRGFTRHLVRFRSEGCRIEFDGMLPEIVLVNSHDRGSSFTLMAGLFRLICSNGMVIQNADFGRVRVRHTGHDIMSTIMESVCSISGNVPRMAEAVDDFQTITLSPNEQGVFAESAAELRWGRDKETGKLNAPFTPDKLLLARRQEDKGGSLWHTYNRVQENMIKGGLRGVSANGRRRVRTRKVSSVSEDVRLNSALWSLTEKMAQLKA